MKKGKKMILKKKYTSSVETVKGSVNSIASHMKKEYNLTSKWTGDSVIVFSSSDGGISGNILITNDEVILKIEKMSLKYKLFSGVIKSKIQEQLNTLIS